MMRNTRSSYACARCYKRKKKCDRNYPACSQCTRARAQCVGLDRGSEAEIPRSLVSYLEELAAQLEVERASVLEQQPVSVPICSQSSGVPSLPFTSQLAPVSALSSSPDNITAAYKLAATTAQECAPVVSPNSHSWHPLPYYRVFFIGAELPFPLAFQEQRPINVPSRLGNAELTQIPDEVRARLTALYTERILPQYPIFSKQEVVDMFQRCNISDSSRDTVNADEQFMLSMIMAIATLSARARDYRKLVSVAESLRRDAFSHFDFGQSCMASSLTTIKKLLLLALYGYLLPASTNLWQVVGDAARIGLELGLHEDIPPESGLHGEEINSRRRLFWTLFALERSVAITSHRPYAFAGDHVHVPFSFSQDQEDAVDHTSSPTPYIRFFDRLRFLQLQSEICSVNIGMRPAPNSLLSYEEWIADVEQRILQVSAQALTPKWCNFMEWHSILLLHMPCARNPEPDEASVRKSFSAAIRLAHGYWELTESGHLDYPWHATHHCYEAGNLILYSLWHFSGLVRKHYSTKQVFEAVHQISGFFILVTPKWPAAQQCGAMFDRLRKGALSFFQEDVDLDPESDLEARQLKELLFRENADLLYAREQPSQPLSQYMPTTVLPEFDADLLVWSDFIELPELPEFGDIGLLTIEDGVEQLNGRDSPVSHHTTSPTSPKEPVKYVFDTVQLKAAMQSIPVCSRCKRRRIKCDLNLPACRNCAKLDQECSYWDNALSEECFRKHVHVLHQHIETLLEEINRNGQRSQPIAGASQLTTDSAHSELAGSNLLLSDRTLPNIFCRSPGNSANPDIIFFGATSAFAQVASKVGALSPSYKDVVAPESPTGPLLDTLWKSVSCNIKTFLPEADARDLVWHYYRSIEITYPILGQDLICDTLDHIYAPSPEMSDGKLSQTRFKLILSISLALMGNRDPRFQILAETYFSEGLLAGVQDDQFVRPTTHSLQATLLLCIYAWIRPDSIDIWRLLGHASRMCLDIIETHGSDKTESANAGILYRTLYALETQVSTSTGRPHQLPDGKEVTASSPDSTLAAVDELSLMVYELSRLRYRLQKDVICRDGVSSGMFPPNSARQDISWMPHCIQEIKLWLGNWNARAEAIFSGHPTPQGGNHMVLPLKLWGECQQCEALLLAKMASDRRNHALFPDEEEVNVCKRLIQAADGLHQISTRLASRSSVLPAFIFPFTWTHTHAIFTATMTILPERINSNVPLGMHSEAIFSTGLDILGHLEQAGDKCASGLVKCLRMLYNCNR